MIAITDNELKSRGIEALITSLGEVQAERFIHLILKEPFDLYRVAKKIVGQQKH